MTTHFNAFVLTFLHLVPTNQDKTTWVANQLPSLSYYCADCSKLSQTVFHQQGWMLHNLCIRLFCYYYYKAACFLGSLYIFISVISQVLRTKQAFSLRVDWNVCDSAIIPNQLQTLKLYCIYLCHHAKNRTSRHKCGNLTSHTTNVLLFLDKIFYNAVCNEENNYWDIISNLNHQIISGGTER